MTYSNSQSIVCSTNHSPLAVLGTGLVQVLQGVVLEQPKANKGLALTPGLTGTSPGLLVRPVESDELRKLRVGA